MNKRWKAVFFLMPRGKLKTLLLAIATDHSFRSDVERLKAFSEEQQAKLKDMSDALKYYYGKRIGFIVEDDHFVEEMVMKNNPFLALFPKHQDFRGPTIAVPIPYKETK